MDVNLVPWSQWQAVYNVATNSLGYKFDHPGAGTGTNYPVTSISWKAAIKWCNARSQLAGLTPVYYSDPGLTLIATNSTGIADGYMNWAANGYRLPTEAEWEKAARGGVNGLRFPWGNAITETQANYTGDTNTYSFDLGPNGPNPIWAGGPSPVGSFVLNGYGLSDMAGNVAQLCLDEFDDSSGVGGYLTGSAHLGGNGRW